MIAVINYDIGNLGSVIKAFEFLNIPVKLTSKPADLKKADGIILPGVGAFAEGMENLEKMGFKKIIKEEVARGKPFFGICLGMQLLFNGSEEGTDNEGLNLIKGKVRKFDKNKVGKIPQIGWNQVDIVKVDPVFNRLDGKNFYFVHSYYCDPDNEQYSLGLTTYGSRTFASVVRKDNVWGMQCHPEKSSKVGLEVLKNFSEVVCSASNTSN